MHLTRKGFNSIVLVWLVPALAMAIYGNTVSTGSASDIYYTMTGITAALILYALFQLFREDGTMMFWERVELAAKAIRSVFVARVYKDTDMTPTAWDDLKEWQREGYRQEATAALDAAGVSPKSWELVQVPHTETERGTR